MRDGGESVDIIGTLNKGIIDKFNISGLSEEQHILCGKDNKEHMKQEHPDDFDKYFNRIEEIINEPTYIAKHPRKDSIEYIKEIEEGGDKVLVAVRASGRGVLFARTLFVMEPEKVEKYRNKNALVPYESVKK